jgi:hypothetical protein
MDTKHLTLAEIQSMAQDSRRANAEMDRILRKIQGRDAPDSMSFAREPAPKPAIASPPTVPAKKLVLRGTKWVME